MHICIIIEQLYIYFWEWIRKPLRILIGLYKNHRIMLLDTFMQGESSLCLIKITSKHHRSLLLLYQSMRMLRNQLSRGLSVSYYQEFQQTLTLVYKAFKNKTIGEHTFNFTKKTMKVFSLVIVKMNQSSKHANLCVEDSKKQALQASSSLQSSMTIMSK